MTPDGSSRRGPGCPSELALEELRTGDLAGSPREAALRQHVEGCPSCQPRFAAISAEGIPPVSLQLRAAAGRSTLPRSRWLVAGGGAAVLGAAAVVALVALPSSHQTERGNRTKGGLVLTVMVQRADGHVDLVDGEGQLRAGETMSFAVQAAQAGRVMVLGLDAAPAATIYVPSDATGTAPSVGSGAHSVLPGGIVADAQMGVERVFAILCAPEVLLDPATLRSRAASALTSAHGHPEAVTSLGTPCTETSVLLHKDPRRP